MKKITSIILAACLVLSLTAVPAYATSTSLSSAQQTVQTLGIMTGDEKGNMNLSGDVTRAQLAKMMIAASAYKDTISSTAKSSPFKDVRYTHWAASYVQAAVTAGWMTGYTDGTFRPDSSIKLEEAVSAVLKMLGYSSSDFTGSFPEAQIAKYIALGLNENISKTQGQILSRQDCMYLFYNLMSTKNKNDKYYATTLGYTINSSGELDYSSLVHANMKGPFIVQDSSWSSLLPFSASTAVVYNNGTASTLSSISTYDVYYYNVSTKTIWGYRNQVTGVYTAASPNASSPTSVTVAGNTYSVSTSAASYDLSTNGNYKIGDTVTLLLGINGDIVGVTSPTSIAANKFGFVVTTGVSTYKDSYGKNHSSPTVTLACTDGKTYTYEYDGFDIKAGALAQISFSGSNISIIQLGDKTLSGKVNAAATALGTYSFSSDIQIMDSTKNGTSAKIYPSRLAGLTLNSGSVRYYELDSAGQISTLILNDVTGDMYGFGVLMSVSESTSDSSSYKYIVDGTLGSFSSPTAFFGVAAGPAQIEFSGDSIIGIKQLTRVQLSSFNSAYAVSKDNTQYLLANNVSVYECKKGSYSLSNASSTFDSNNLYGYFDKPESEGGRMRVIISYEY